LWVFRPNTACTRWRWTGDGPAYASPIAVDLAGTRQIVTQSQSRIVSVAADTGALLWSLPFTTPYMQNIVTPLVVNDVLVFSGLDNGVLAVRPVRSGSTWSAEQIWKTDAVGMYMNSPVLKGHLVFGFSHKHRGQFLHGRRQSDLGAPGARARRRPRQGRDDADPLGLGVEPTATPCYRRSLAAP